MKRVFLFVCLLLPSYAMAQDLAANKPAAPPKAEEKAKPVILKKDGELKELRLATLELENLQLRAQAMKAEFEKLQEQVKKADDGVTAFWAKLGINRTELPTKWEATDGQNGDIILKRKEDAPKAEEKKSGK